LVRLRFDGSFSVQRGGVMVVAPDADREAEAVQWLQANWGAPISWADAARQLLEAWWLLSTGRGFGDPVPTSAERDAGWRAATADGQIELGWLNRQTRRAIRYEALDPAKLSTPVVC